jgi:hypothetical protein
MHQGLLRAIHERMSARPDDELLRLWVENDRFQYSPETFEAVRSIFAERGITPPAQDEPPAMASRAANAHASETPADEADARAWVLWLRPILWVGVALGLSKLLSWIALFRQYFEIYDQSRNYLAGWRVGAIFAEMTLSLALPCCLLVGVWAALRRRAAAGRVLWAYVLAALGLAGLRFLVSLYAEHQSSYGIRLGFVLQQPEAILQSNLYPLVLLVLMRRPQFREWLEPSAPGFALDRVPEQATLPIPKEQPE